MAGTTGLEPATSDVTVADGSSRTDWLNPLKFLPIGRDGWFATIGGEVRERFELLGQTNFGAGLEDENGYFLQRYLLSGAGAISGGLTDFSPPSSGYFLLDHDQRHTLHAGFSFSLPRRTFAGGNLYYGSGFTDGSSAVPAHLQEHTTFDLSVGKTIGESLTLSATALNLTNRRFLLDNSVTFGGTHYADPRQIYVELRYRFHW